ncbi:MAG: UDP-N-acetylmuramate dehydrogenase [Acetobacteraceae bacterium]
MEIEEHVPLASRTTFRIGGNARFFSHIRSREELRQAFAFAQRRDLPAFLLGGGSNTLASDAGFDGLVIKVGLSGVVLEHDASGVLLISAAGEPFDAVVARAAQEGLWGVENLSGIPGSVGGAVAQNVGAYGVALCERLVWVETFDPKTGKFERLTSDDCRFGYRDSIFAHSQKVVLSAAFALSRAPTPNLSYKDLRVHFAEEQADWSLPNIRQAVLAIRCKKFPDLAKEGTAGSFFKNPTLSAERARAFKERYPTLPLFPIPGTEDARIPLAFVLDRGLGLNGKSVGNARLFERQPLVIVVRSGASSHEVVALADYVARKVFEVYRIATEWEVCMLGRKDGIPFSPRDGSYHACHFA